MRKVYILTAIISPLFALNTLFLFNLDKITIFQALAQVAFSLTLELYAMHKANL